MESARAAAAMMTPAYLANMQHIMSGQLIPAQGLNHERGLVVQSTVGGISMGDPSGDGEGFGFGLPGTVGGASAAPLMKHGRWNATDVVVEYHRTMWRDATKNSRRVYVHNLNTAIIGVDAKDELGKTLHDAVMVAGAAPWHGVDGTEKLHPKLDAPTGVVEKVFISDKGYSFVEGTAVEDACALLALDGIVVRGNLLKIRRPKDYVASENPLVVDGTMKDVMKRTFEKIIRPSVPDTNTKIFLGNLGDRELDVLELKEIIASFGRVRAMRAETDAHGRIKRGRAWFEYLDPTVAPHAVSGLTGVMVNGRRLVAAFATPDAPDVGDVREEDGACAYEVPAAAEPLLRPEQRVLAFENVLAAGMDAAAMKAAIEDVKLECESLGNVLSTHVVDVDEVDGEDGGGGGENAAKGAKTKPADDDDDADEKPEEEEEEDKEGAEEAAGPVDTSVYRGKVFVEFARVETATVAAHRFHRRLFDGRSVKIEYFPIAEYQRAFAKGVPPRTHEELQAAAIKAQEIVANLRSHGR
jgi:splicing factor U2AF subunit